MNGKVDVGVISAGTTVTYYGWTTDQLMTVGTQAVMALTLILLLGRVIFGAYQFTLWCRARLSQ